MQISWQDPVFGYIPDDFKDWYMKESGTIFKNGKWYVDGEVLEVKEFNQKGKTFKINIYKATNFQNKMISTKEYIIAQMPFHADYTLGHQHIFRLMRDKEVGVQYKLDGQEFLQTIK